MPFATDLQKSDQEKITLAVVSPRKRVTGWTQLAPNIFYKYLPYGTPTEIFDFFNGSGTIPFQRVASIGALNTAGRTYYWEAETQVLTVTTALLGNPDSFSYPGLTVQTDICIASRPIYGQRDPLDATWADVVDWEPALISAPYATNGTTDDFFGFQPSSISGVQIANTGWLNKWLYDFSFFQAPISIYVLVGSDYERAVQSLGVFQTFRGFVTGISEADRVVSIAAKDYSAILENQFTGLTTFTTSNFPLLDPAASAGNWKIPLLRGVVDGVEPVNIDYNATPATNNNRTWVTHYFGGETIGTVTETVDHTIASASDTTYFLNTPPFNVYDTLILTRNGGTYYVQVSEVNRASKFIKYSAINGSPALTGAAHLAGETSIRYFVGLINVFDGTLWHTLAPLLHFTVSTSLPTNSARFTLQNNFEAASPGFPAIFDPSTHKIYCRLYGTVDQEQYEDATTVGTLSEASGVDSDGVALVFRTLLSAGFVADDIDTDSFTSVGADSNALGYLVPSARGVSPQSYKEIISQLLQSQIWKISSSIGSDGKIRIGLSAVEPIPAVDYSLDKTEFADFSWEQEYSDIYSDFEITYKPASSPDLAPAFPSWNQHSLVLSDQSDSAVNVHKVTKTYSATILQIDATEAQTIADRFKFILGERRGFYRFKTPYTQLINAKVGVTYQITRDHLPGFDYAVDAENQRDLKLVEVQKDVNGISMVLEDQKGIQDNSGSW